eukprot:g2851.t1
MKSNDEVEIFTYNAPEPIYAMSWNNRPESNSQLALCSFHQDRVNSLEILELNENTGVFHRDPVNCTKHEFPATKVMFSPDSTSIHSDLLATSSDALCIWRLTNGQGLELKCRLLSDKNPHYSKALTSFDWNPQEPTSIATCSIDHSCTIWNIESQTVEKQLIAHTDEVSDIAWSCSPGIFATVSTDGSVRIFDRRNIGNSSVIYESARTALVRVAWNRVDARYLATVAQDDHRVMVLDIRYPTIPIAELERHKGPVNAVIWAPHSSCHLCTAGDDGQALIWDLTSVQQPMEKNLDPILSYEGSSEILQLEWCNGRPDWIAISFNKMAQILRV